MTLENKIIELMGENSQFHERARTSLNGFSSTLLGYGVEIEGLKKNYHKYDYVVRSNADLETVQAQVNASRHDSAISPYARPQVYIEKLKTLPISVITSNCDYYLNNLFVFDVALAPAAGPLISVSQVGNIFYGGVFFLPPGPEREVVSSPGNSTDEVTYMINPILYNGAIVGRGIQQKNGLKMKSI